VAAFAVRAGGENAGSDSCWSPRSSCLVVNQLPATKENAAN